MTLIEPVIRPPSEADSFLLQVTLGCSQNCCKFCGAYQNKPFKVKPLAEIKKDIELGAKLYPDTDRVFLCDGDALVLNNARLVPILNQLAQSFPRLRRVASYANAANILHKSEPELKELSDRKLKLIFLGLESGSAEILRSMHKEANPAEMVAAVDRARRAGIKTHAILLLGLGQSVQSKTHALESARILNQMQPKYLSVLSLMLVPGTLLYQDWRNGQFTELTPRKLIQETIWLLEKLELRQSIFRCNHASNYLPLEGRLPQDKEKIIATLRSALHGEINLKPEMLRGL